MLRNLGLVPPAVALVVRQGQTGSAMLRIAPSDHTQIDAGLRVVDASDGLTVSRPLEPLQLTIHDPNSEQAILASGDVDVQVVLNGANKPPGS